MSSLADVVFQTAEAISAVSLPVGGGLAAYLRWRKNAEAQRRVREEAARIASDTAAKEARREEQAMRDRLLKEKDDRIKMCDDEIASLRADNDRLHNQIIVILQGNAHREGSQQ